ncbi:hypothetical protein Sango_2486200 [Sesamum angolense]|uniref:CCHC-type domain-containing protein n=1 Tax=Sesamum angolense TaxID=2727404 RepID=A0AAE1W3N7_9LAMI|nr:hypothetical protein Sango_2486200 [Sesamum angolense]
MDNGWVEHGGEWNCSKLPKYIVIMMPNEHGGESACKVDVEYEWLPPKCTSCTSLGHVTKECPLTKSAKPAVLVYVRKNAVQTPAPESMKGGQVLATPDRVGDHPVAEVDMVSDELADHRRDKTIWNVWGLNRRDHQVAVRDLVTEFRLHFIALLETKVMPSNVTRLQAGLLSRWRWFVDYSGPGNRIWIAWNDEFIDVDILDIGTQFVHCRALIHEMHEPILTTVIYGANDVSARRELWQGLTDLAVSVDNVPWLVGGDFNAVLDMSEVSGASEDIRVAMNDFNDCILQTSLISFLCKESASHGTTVVRIDGAYGRDWTGDSRNVQVSMFWFDNYLALSPGFLASVHNIWQHPVFGSPMYSVTRKLKALKQVFRQQRQKKGDLAMNVKLASGFLEVAQKLLQVDRHNPLLLQLEHCCRLVYLKATKLEHVMLRQRAKLQWLKGGDQCSKSLLGGVRTDRVLHLHYLCPWARHILTEEEARALIRPVTIDDVKTTLFDIEENKAPGPDGFSSGFYKAAWPIVGEEFSKAIMDFFTTGRWIEECVTSAHLLVYVNSGVHGFFVGAWGLRQGDPMSPYLFVLVMEVLQMILQQFIEQDGEFLYHWRCQELKLFQLSFADDLLLLCKADVRSVNLFRRRLNLFASLSGLHTNSQKSQLIISKAASGLRDTLLATLGFQEGHLPVRYLGLPLIAARLSIADCQPLLQKIDSRIKGWEGVQLSFAERVQLIKFVLVSLEVYWAMTFILPKGIIKEMIKRLRTFLWRGTSSIGYTKVAWEVVCRPVEEGSQGDGNSFSLWHDPWHPLGPLIIRFPRGPQLTNIRLLDKLNVVMANGQWNSPMITDIACLEITQLFPPILEGTDRISWKSIDGSFTTTAAYALFHPLGPKEHNTWRFQQRSRPPLIVGALVVEEIRQKIISVHLRQSVSTLGLYRLWKIPWPVKGYSD